MAVYMNADICWWLGKQGIAAFAKSASLASQCNALNTTPIKTSDRYVELIGGLKSGQVSMDLMSDAAANGLDDRLWGYAGTSGVTQSFSIGSAAGSVAYTMQSQWSSYTPWTGAPGDLATGSLQCVSSGVIARGVLLAGDGTAVTSSSTSTPFQVGALSASQRMYVGLHVTAVSGTSPTLAVVLQSDNGVGFASPTNRATLTTETNLTAGYQSTSVAGAVTDDWWRVSYTLGGTTPSFAFAVVVGIAG